MDEKKLKALAAELAKGLKTEADLNAFCSGQVILAMVLQ